MAGASSVSLSNALVAQCDDDCDGANEDGEHYRDYILEHKAYPLLLSRILHRQYDAPAVPVILQINANGTEPNGRCRAIKVEGTKRFK